MDGRFKIGDPVKVVGVLGDFYNGKTGIVVSVHPNVDGIRELDLYVISISGRNMHDTKLADFELAPSPTLVPETV